MLSTYGPSVGVGLTLWVLLGQETGLSKGRRGREGHNGVRVHSPSCGLLASGLHLHWETRQRHSRLSPFAGGALSAMVSAHASLCSPKRLLGVIWRGRGLAWSRDHCQHRVSGCPVSGGSRAVPGGSYIPGWVLTCSMKLWSHY